MKFIIDKSEFINALNIVQKGVTTKSTLPALSGILCRAFDNCLSFESTDLETSIKYNATSLIEEEGRSVVPAKLFVDIIKNMPDSAVHVETKDTDAIIQCENTSFNIKILNDEDFPEFPKINEEESVEISFNQFSSMVRRVSYSVSKDDTRLILTGILIEVSEGRIKMVATDSYRLAITEAEYTGNKESEFKAVIDGNFLKGIAALVSDAQTIKICASENQILITYGNMTFVSRRIEGTYPNYKQLLPSSFDTQIKIKKEDILQGVKRASLLCTKNSPLRLTVSIENQAVYLSVNTLDLGAVQETILCNCEGKDLNIAYNSAYFIEGLAAFKSDEVTIKLQDYPKPGIIRSEEDPEFTYLIMPMRN